MEIVGTAMHSENPLDCRVWCVNWHYNGEVLVSSGEDRSFKLWKLMDSQEPRFKLLNVIRDDQKRTIRWVTFSPCGRYVASASFDASVMVYEFKDNDFEEVTTLEGHENEIKCCQFSTSGEFLATCSRDKTVWVWQVAGGEYDDYEVASILQTHTADVKFVAWHPNEDRMWINTCSLISPGQGHQRLFRFYKSDGEDWITAQKIDDAHGDTVWSGAFSGDSSPRLVTCSADGVIKVWAESDENGERRWRLVADYTLTDTKWPLYSISWSKRNGLIAVGGGDRLLRLFSFDSANSALVMQASVELDSEINCVSWCPGGEKWVDTVAAGCDDGKIVLLKASDSLLVSRSGQGE